jgi:putative SOS response-associated peptidase YedK
MCYNISNTIKEEKILEKRLVASYPKKLGQLSILYSVSGFTHPELPILTQDSPNEFQLYSWGLVPKWTPNADLATQFANNNLNAKSETLFEKPSFAESIEKKRCLVPITGFFEWREVNKIKYPYYIRMKENEIFCLAGIYDAWINKTSGEVLNTFSIVTTEANALMAKIHNIKLRMPVILPQDAEKKWLEPNLTALEIKNLMTPLDDRLMEAYTISRRITNKTLNPNVPETIERMEYPELSFMDALGLF